MFGRETNSVTIETDGRLNGDLSILLSSEKFDFDSKITVIKDGVSYEITPQIRIEVMEETLRERGDPSYIFEDSISLSQLTDGR